MKFPVILSTVALVAAVLAAPAPSLTGIEAAIARRRASNAFHGIDNISVGSGLNRTHFKRQTENQPTGIEPGGDISSNWGGAILNSAPDGEVFNIVSASFVVPALKDAPAEGDTDYATFWVGIDGNGDSTDVVQIGVLVGHNSDGQTIANAWYEWYPAPPVYLERSAFPIVSGDTITLNLALNSDLVSALAIISNSNSAATEQTINFSAPDGTKASGNCAEFIVERAAIDDDYEPLANFGTVTFTGVAAETNDNNYDLSQNPEIINIINSDNDVLASATLVDDKTLRVDWVAAA